MICIYKILSQIIHPKICDFVRFICEASAAEHAIQHLGEQRDQLRGELQGQQLSSCFVLQSCFNFDVF